MELEESKIDFNPNIDESKFSETINFDDTIIQKSPE